jgi:gluconolactonase
MKHVLLQIALVAAIAFSAIADNTPKLDTILIPGEDWQPVVQGLGFADGLSCNTTTGDIFFSDMKAKDPEKPGIYTLSPDGQKKKLLDGKFSGTRPSADCKTLYACGSGKVIAFPLPAGPEKVLVDKVGTNDLAVTRHGLIYTTGNGKQQVTLLDPQTHEAKPADVGNIKNPNGIGLSPDQKNLIVSDYNGTHVWTFTIQPDGTLTDRKSPMTMTAPEKKPDVAGGDGMAIDSDGRAYVTTIIGLQIFAPTGELLGVLPKPKNSSLVSCTFGGKDLNYLYVACGDTIYRRKTLAKGVSFAPAEK